MLEPRTGAEPAVGQWVAVRISLSCARTDTTFRVCPPAYPLHQPSPPPPSTIPSSIEWNIIYDKLAKCAESGAKIVLSRYAIGDLATQYFADRDIFCAGRVRRGAALQPFACVPAGLAACISVLSNAGGAPSMHAPALSRARASFAVLCPAWMVG